MNREFANYIGIINNEKKYKFKTLFIEITNRCNYNCKHCYNSSSTVNKVSIELKQFEKIIKDFVKNGIDSVVLSGGEALLHENIWEMLDILNSYNLEITLLTNGKLLSKNIIDKLKGMKANVQLSLDGANAKTNDYVRQAGSYNDVMNALMELKKQSYMDKVSVNSVITHESVSEISDIIKICEKFNVSTIGFSFLNKIGRAKNSNLITTEEEVYQAINEINSYIDSSSIIVKPINVAKRCRFCDTANDIYLNPVVDVYGNVYMCEFLRSESFNIGNIFKQNLSEILSDEKIKSNMIFINLRRHFITSCRICSLRSNCEAGCIMQCKIDNYFEPNFCEIIKKNFISELGG